MSCWYNFDAQVPNALDRAEIKEWNARTVDVATTAAVSTTGAEGRSAAVAMVRGRSLLVQEHQGRGD